jgi:hypothetical protein
MPARWFIEGSSMKKHIADLKTQSGFQCVSLVGFFPGKGGKGI